MKVTGGSAFPLQTAIEGFWPGMTLRDWFASQADIPWEVVRSALLINRGITTPTNLQLVEYRAELKYIEADEMLKERDKLK